MLMKDKDSQRGRGDMASRWMSPGMRNGSFASPRHCGAQSEHGWFWAMAHKSVRHH